MRWGVNAYKIGLRIEAEGTRERRFFPVTYIYLVDSREALDTEEPSILRAMVPRKSRIPASDVP